MESRAPLGSYLSPGLEHATAGDVASTDVLQVTPTDPLTEVVRRMVEHATTHAVVVDGPHAPVRGCGVDARHRGHRRLGSGVIGR